MRLINIVKENELQKAPDSYLGTEINTVFESLNQAVYSKTNGIIDLHTTISLSLVALGIRQIIKNKTNILPTGLTLIWWAYNSLVANGNGKK